VTSRLPSVLALALCLAPLALAEKVDERQAIALLAHRSELPLKADTQMPEHAMARIHFWVDRDGMVEAVEQVCGERAVFDEIVDAILDWEFRPRPAGPFVTDLSFERTGRRIVLSLELPEAARHRASDCSQ